MTTNPLNGLEAIVLEGSIERIVDLSKRVTFWDRLQETKAGRWEILGT
jgi:hypothetical protein